MRFSIVSNILIISALICANVMVILWRRRKVRGAKWLSLVMLAMAIWGFAEAMEMASPTYETKILWAKIGYIGMASGAPLLVIFSYHHMNSQKREEFISGPGSKSLFKTLEPFLWIIPVVTVLLAWTNEYHHLIWNGFHFISVGSMEVMLYSHGPWFWVHVTFTYMLLTISAIMLIVAALRFRHLFKKQTITLLISIPIPISANLIYIFASDYFRGVDVTPIGFALTGVILTYGIYSYYLMDLTPFAREMLMEFLPEAVIVIDTANRVLDLNPAVNKMLGKALSLEIGDNIDHLLAQWIPPDQTLTDKSQFRIVVDQNALANMGVDQTDSPKGYFDMVITPFQRQGAISGRIMIFTEITERINTEELLFETNEKLNSQLVEIHILKDQIEELAVRDPLTGLYNRRFLNETLNREFARASREHYLISIAMIDVDHFKLYNDSFGHPAGDEVLVKLAKHLVDYLREGDVVVRYGGEEFIVILPFANAETAETRIDELRYSFSEIRHRPDDMNGVTFSAGIASFPQHGKNFDQVLKAADLALYCAKQNGRNKITIVDQETARINMS